MAVEATAARTTSYTFEQMTAGYEKSGTAYEKALKDFDTAASSGDTSKIAVAQAKLQKAERIFSAYQSVVEKAHQMMMRLINGLSNR